MTPAVYIETIVIPTVKEAMAARGDRRPNYLACIVSFHALDYIAATRGEKIEAVQSAVEATCPAVFTVARGVCNGTKHAGNRSGYRHQPGSEQVFKPFGFGPDCGGFGDGRWDFPGLGVEHDGVLFFLDFISQALLLKTCRAYSQDLGSVDLSFIDPYILTNEANLIP